MKMVFSWLDKLIRQPLVRLVAIVSWLLMTLVIIYFLRVVLPMALLANPLLGAVIFLSGMLLIIVWRPGRKKREKQARSK